MSHDSDGLDFVVPIYSKKTASRIFSNFFQNLGRLILNGKELIVVIISAFVIGKHVLETFAVACSIQSKHPLHISWVILLFLGVVEVFDGNCYPEV